MKLNEIAYFMKSLDEVKEFNGKSLLENSLFTISTESGDGRHNNTKRELSGVFHAITSGGGKFKTGEIMDVKAQGLDLYNTIVSGMGSKLKLGPKNHESQIVGKIMA